MQHIKVKEEDILLYKLTWIWQPAEVEYKEIGTPLGDEDIPAHTYDSTLLHAC